MGQLDIKNSCILVKEEGLRYAKQDEYGKEFLSWLKAEGFENISTLDLAHGDWIFINIYTKKIMYGKQGIKMAEPVFEHAVTIKEFITIYNIYKKYMGLNPLEMGPSSVEEEIDKLERIKNHLESEEKKEQEQLSTSEDTIKCENQILCPNKESSYFGNRSRIETYGRLKESPSMKKHVLARNMKIFKEAIELIIPNEINGESTYPLTYKERIAYCYLKEYYPP